MPPVQPVSTEPEPLGNQKPGMIKMIEALKPGPLRFEQWLEQSGISRRYFNSYRRELLRNKTVEYEALSRRYSLTEKGKETYWGITTSEFLKTHLPSMFRWSLGIEGPWSEELGGNPMIIDYALSSVLSFDQPIGELEEIFKERMAKAPIVLMEEIANLAVKRNLLQRHGATQGALGRVSRKKWKEIFKELCPQGNELVYVERIDLRDLLKCLTHRKFSGPGGIAMEVHPRVEQRPQPSTALGLDPGRMKRKRS